LITLAAPRSRDDYLAHRRRYQPDAPSLIIIAESPPASGRYFYDAGGAVTEPLFAALMKQLGVSPGRKEPGLQAFKQRGWVLVDATYEPVNKLTSSKRDSVILRDYPTLREDVRELVGRPPAGILLLKANICRLLEQKLTGDGFTVLNHGRRVYFPSNGRQTDFHRQFGQILNEAA
jgi:hypothetical protein